MSEKKRARSYLTGAKNDRIAKITVLIFFVLYLIIGIIIFKDYSISTDEPTERISTLVNAKAVLEKIAPEKAKRIQVPELDTYKDRYYGTAVQMPTVILEMGDLSLRALYHARHLYTFIICFLGYIAFFDLCMQIFHNRWLSLVGTAMISLYPRFFAEQFYNIKDMIFVSFFIFSMLATVRLIESRYKVRWIIISSVVFALTTTVRIVGIIFLLVVVIYMVMEQVLPKSERYKECMPIRTVMAEIIVMIVTYFGAFIFFMPYIWGNPLRRTIETFTVFSKFEDWNSAIVFMGSVIDKTQLRWYYIPIWLLISLPLWYLILAAVTIIIGIARMSQKTYRSKKLSTRFFEHKYVWWSASLFMIPWLGIVIRHSTIYNAWRHCYFMLPPIVIILLYAIRHIIAKSGNMKKMIYVLIIAGLGIQTFWICRNHPYEMVYLNSIGSHYGADFDRDYWHMASLDAAKYIIENEEREHYTIGTSGTDHYLDLLPEEESKRIKVSDNPDYYIETYRGKIGNNPEKKGYSIVYSIKVDGFDISSVYKKNDIK